MTETRSDEYVRLRIRTEYQNQLREVEVQRLYRNDPLDVEVLMTDFPKTRHGRAELTDHRGDQPHADEIFLEEEALNGHVGSDGDIVYNSVISVRKAGHSSARAVRMIQQDEHLVGLQFLLEGKDYVILYNTGSEPMETAFLNELTGSLDAVNIYRTTLRAEKVQGTFASGIDGLDPIQPEEIVVLQF